MPSVEEDVEPGPTTLESAGEPGDAADAGDTSETVVPSDPAQAEEDVAAEADDEPEGEHDLIGSRG